MIDGDSVELTQLDLGFSMRIKASLRVIGLDTPERHTEPGKIVTTVVRLWLAQSDTLLVNSVDLDKYGRVLGDIRRSDHTWLSEYLLHNRIALPYDGGTKPEWSGEQLARVTVTANQCLARLI